MNSRVERTKSILVIDDEPMVLQLCKRVLESEGYNVNLATDGVFGMALYREKKPDLVLLDIMMPGPDGYQVVELIRQDDSVPIIMITGRRDIDSLEKALNLGADDCVRKPFLPLELVARIRAKLKRLEITES